MIGGENYMDDIDAGVAASEQSVNIISGNIKDAFSEDSIAL